MPVASLNLVQQLLASVHSCCAAEVDDAGTVTAASMPAEDAPQDLENEDGPAGKRKQAVFDSDEEDEAPPAHPDQLAGATSQDDDMADVFGSDDDE